MCNATVTTVTAAEMPDTLFADPDGPFCRIDFACGCTVYTSRPEGTGDDDDWLQGFTTCDAHLGLHEAVELTALQAGVYAQLVRGTDELN